MQTQKKKISSEDTHKRIVRNLQFKTVENNLAIAFQVQITPESIVTGGIDNKSRVYCPCVGWWSFVQLCQLNVH